MAKICVFLAEGFEEIEAISILDILRRGGLKAESVSITQQTTVEGAHGIKITTDTCFNNVDYSEVDGLILPGGMPGTQNLGNHERLGNLLKSFNNKSKLIGAICAAPSVLGELGILKGKRAVCYPGFEEKMKGAIIEVSNVVQDGHVVTGMGPGVSIKFGLQILKMYKDETYVKELADNLILN